LFWNQSVAYESLWHLVIPPVMTLLDDYEAAYKYVVLKLFRNARKGTHGFALGAQASMDFGSQCVSLHLNSRPTLTI